MEFVSADSARILRAAETFGPGPLAAAAGLYLFSHLLRVLRLAVILGGDVCSLRRLGRAQLVGAALSALTPFKLGELYRIYEFGRQIGSPARAFLTIWFERALDAGAVVFLLAGAIAFPRAGGIPAPLAFGSLALLLSTILAFQVLPQSVGPLKLHIIRRYDGSRALPALRALDAAARFLARAPALPRRKHPALAALTLMIWAAETGVLILLVPQLGTLAGPFAIAGNAMTLNADRFVGLFNPIAELARADGLAGAAEIVLYQTLVLACLVLMALLALGLRFVEGRR